MTGTTRGVRPPAGSALLAGMVALLAMLLASVAAAAGTAAAPVVPAAATTRTAVAPITAVTRGYTVKVGGISRGYTLIAPSSGSRGKPMVVFLSGTSAGTASEISRDHLMQFVTAGLVSLVYPIGLNRQWNVGPSCCTSGTTPKADDQAYVRQITRLAADQLKPNVKQIYLIGYSAGAKLGWQIVCANRGPFAAFASYGGNPETTCPTRGLQLPVFIGFGIADTNEPIAGRPSDRRGVHPPAAVNVNTWLVRDGCSSRRYHTAVLQGQISVTGYTPCARAGLTVQFAIWEHSTHTIPQIAVSAPAGYGPVAWQFVSKFTRT